MPLRCREIVFGGLSGNGLVVVVREELADHAACAVGQIWMLGERAHSADQRVVPVHQQQRKIGFL